VFLEPVNPVLPATRTTRMNGNPSFVIQSVECATLSPRKGFLSLSNLLDKYPKMGEDG